MDRRTRIFMAGGLVLAVAVAALLSLFASSQPDGLERVAIDQGFEEAAEDPVLDSPLADYAVEGVANEKLSGALAGIIGVAITLGLTVGILGIVRWQRRSGPGSAA